MASQRSHPVRVQTPSPEIQARNSSVLVCLFLALGVWAVFGQTRHFDFVNYDDDFYVYHNPAVIKGLSWSGVVWAFTHSLAGNWHPLTVLSHMLDCQLYGLHPGGHHLTNVLLHMATVLSLFLVLKKMTGALWRSAFVAAVFAIHPLRAESVAWVAERKDVLSGLFFMLTLLAYARYARPSTLNPQPSPVGDDVRSPFPRLVTSAPTDVSLNPQPSTHRTLNSQLSTLNYFAALLFFALGLMSKPMLVTLPFVLLLLDYWPLQRFDTRDLRIANFRLPSSLVTRHSFLEKIPFLLLAIADCAATVWAQSQLGAMASGREVHLAARLANALIAYAAYLGQMIYPAGLAAFYPHPGKHFSHWEAGLSVLVLFIVSVGVLAGRRKYPFLVAGWLWYLGMLIPVIGLVQVGGQARADRYTYLPQIGLYIMIAWGAVELCGSWRHRRVLLGAAGALSLTALLVCARAQTAYWRNSESLWTHALACTSDNAVAHDNLGAALMGQGKPAEAIEQYQQALRLQPGDAAAHNNLGSALAAQGNLAPAIEQFQQALKLKPDFADAQKNLANALSNDGKVAQAIEHYQLALRLNPDDPEVHYNFGNALAGQGKLAQAIEHYEQALRLNPDLAEAQNNLANALADQGKLDEAIGHYRLALQLKPDSADAQYNLGDALFKQGKLDEAIQHYRQALTLALARNDAAFVEAIRARLKSVQAAPPTDGH